MYKIISQISITSYGFCYGFTTYGSFQKLLYKKVMIEGISRRTCWARPGACQPVCWVDCCLVIFRYSIATTSSFYICARLLLCSHSYKLLLLQNVQNTPNDSGRSRLMDPPNCTLINIGCHTLHSLIVFLLPFSCPPEPEDETLIFPPTILSLFLLLAGAEPELEEKDGVNEEEDGTLLIGPKIDPKTWARRAAGEPRRT